MVDGSGTTVNVRAVGVAQIVFLLVEFVLLEIQVPPEGIPNVTRVPDGLTVAPGEITTWPIWINPSVAGEIGFGTA
jgi:hypothetical protein